MPKEPFEKYWAPVAAIIGAVLLVINFFNALQGDKAFVTFALILVSLVAIIAGMWKYAFALSNKPFEKNGKFGFDPKYKYHWVAKITILLCVISVVASIAYILTVVGIMPDCCGIVPTKIPTATVTLNIASTSTKSVAQTSTPIITATNALTNNPTSTPTNLVSTQAPPPTLIPQLELPDYFITDCIAYEVWYFWKGNGNLPTRLNEQNRRCYDLTNWHLTAQRKDVNSDIQGLRINIDSDRNIMNGIFLPLGDEAQIKMSLDIEQLTSNIKCRDGEFCDANLIVGFGDPNYDKSGWFVVFRALEKDSGVYTCILRSPFSPCGEPKVIELGNIFLKHDLEFTLNGQDTSLRLDGNLYEGPSIAEMRRQLWIGYQIRSSGVIKGFFQFK